MKKVLAFICLLCTAAVTSAQVTFTALDGTDGYNDEDIPCLFDGLSSKWCASASGAWFSFEASELITLTGYAMRTGSDGETENNNRNPKSWTIYGSNDNSSWTQIQQVTDNTDMDGKQQKTFYFSINSHRAPYKYYKVTIEAVQDGSNVQISEFIPSYEDPTPNHLNSYAGAHWWGTQPYTYVTDGSSLSTWISGDTRNWIAMESSESVVLTSYSITTGADTQNWSGRNPSKWTVYGSNTKENSKDGSTWEVIDHREGGLENVNSTPHYFTCSNTKSFKYYMLVIEAVNDGQLAGGDYSKMCQISGFDINPHQDHTASCTYSFAGGGTNQQVELCDICNKAMTSGYKGFTLVDGKPFQVFVNGWGGNGSFTYSRSVSSNMGTICLPYSMNAGNKEDATYYTLAFYNSESDVLVFDEVTGNLPAFTPALYITESDAPTTINLDNKGGAAFSVTPTNNVTKQDRAKDGWEMVGTVKNGTASEISKSIYYLKGGDFYRCNGSISFKPYRAYITGPLDGSSVKAFGIADDMEDAINEIMPAENGEIQLFDLSGRKVSKVRNGETYIMNGRKVKFNK